MSASNGVIRIGRKGTKKFAFGEDGPVFEVDVVTVFQRWICIDKDLRATEGPDEGAIPAAAMETYHFAAVQFAEELSGGPVTTAEALDFLARLREVYDDLADFFQPKSSEERASPDTLAVGLRFSVEES